MGADPRWDELAELARVRGEAQDRFTTIPTADLSALLAERTALAAEVERLREGEVSSIDACIAIVEQSLATVRAEAGDLPSGRAGIAAREGVIALLQGYREHEATR